MDAPEGATPQPGTEGLLPGLWKWGFWGWFEETPTCRCVILNLNEGSSILRAKKTNDIQFRVGITFPLGSLAEVTPLAV